MNENPLQLITALGPHRLYLLIILITIGGPILQSRLEAVTGWHYKTVSKHLDYLLELQLAHRDGHRGGWTATLAARQLLLSYPQEGASYPQTYPQAANSQSAKPHTVRFETSPGEVSGDLVVSSSRYVDKEEQGFQPLLLGQGETSPGEVSQFAENSDALADYGIEEPARSQLAAMPHVTPRYIDAHCATVIADGKPIALAIYRIKSKWKPPKLTAKTESHLSEHGHTRQYLSWSDNT